MSIVVDKSHTSYLEFIRVASQDGVDVGVLCVVPDLSMCSLSYSHILHINYAARLFLCSYYK